MSIDHYLTGTALTADYEPPYQSFVTYLYDPNRPIFTTMAIDAMMSDPRVTLGMALLRGPILSNSRFFVHCENPEVKKFIADQINRFWRNSADLVLDSMVYGSQPAEIIYRTIEGQLQFDKLKYIHPRDGKVRVLRGGFCGFDVGGIPNREDTNPLFIGVPKAFWSTHRRRKHRWYGQSRLYGAFPAWYEKWARRGFRDQRQLFFFKYAFRGPIIQYPQGSVPPPVGSPEGTLPTDFKRVAQEMGDKFASGSTLTLPAPDPLKPSWNFIDPAVQGTPEGFLEYGRDLDDEIWEGMEIPPEVARAARGGGEGISIGGGGGRDIPQQAFYSILSEISLSTMTDLDEQILMPAVDRRWGRDTPYEIECFGLLRGQDQSSEPGAFEQAQGDETSNMGGDKNERNQVQMSQESVRPPLLTMYNSREDDQLRRHYRRISDYQFRLGRSA